MKESIKTAVLFVIVVIIAILVSNTKGDDPLKWNVDIDLSGWPTVQKETFSYPVVKSDYNGQYRNSKGNGMFALLGENSDGTYRIYFIHQVASLKNVIIRVDNGRLENNKISFKNAQGTPLYVVLGDGSFNVDADLGYGDAQVEGYYAKMKSINTFSMDEFEYFNY